MGDIFKIKLSIENSKLNSGFVEKSIIPVLKEQNYFVIPIPLDGEAPKEYIKAYFYYKNCPKKEKPKSWHGFFAKFGGKSYPHESVVEYTINRIGDYLDLNMNKTRLVVANKQIRFLSQNFLAKNKKLIHGIEIITEYFEDENFVQELNADRTERRKYLTFEVVEKAIEKVYPNGKTEIISSLVKLLTYDAIVGNNDRHFYNWGLIGDVYKINKKPPIFAPIYDTARALLWNKTDSQVIEMLKHYKNGSNELEYFIKKSKPRFSFENNPNANHFQLIKNLVTYNTKFRHIVEDLISFEKEKTVIYHLRNNEFKLFLNERSEMMEIILKKRFKTLREII